MSTIQLVVDTYTKKRRPRAETIKKRLNIAFEKHPDLTHKQLADHCKVTAQAVSKWVRTGEIARDNIASVASFFGERPGWLMDDMTEVGEPSSSSYGFSEADRRLLQLFHALPKDLQKETERFLQTLAKYMKLRQ